MLDNAPQHVERNSTKESPRVCHFRQKDVKLLWIQSAGWKQWEPRGTAHMRVITLTMSFVIMVISKSQDKTGLVIPHTDVKGESRAHRHLFSQ